MARTYEPATPSGAENTIDATASGHSTTEALAEPQVRYIDNVCGAVSDLGAGELQPAGSILRGETSGCLLQLPAERVAEASRGRGPRTPQPPSPARIMDRVIELVARAVASQYLWDWGDGNDTLTNEPGRPWSRLLLRQHRPRLRNPGRLRPERRGRVGGAVAHQRWSMAGARVLLVERLGRLSGAPGPGSIHTDNRLGPSGVSRS